MRVDQPPRARWPASVALVAVAAFASSLGNGFALDDVMLVRDNPQLEGAGPRALVALLARPYWSGPEGRAAGLYRPVTIASLAVNRRLGGPAPLGFHAGNVLLHAVVSCLAWYVLRQASVHYGTALAGGLLFAVHPLHTEVVANVAGRAELLGALFVLAAWLAHRRAATRPAWSLLAGVAYLAALLSKENTALAPLVFVVACGVGPRAWRLARHVPYLVALGLALALRAHALAGVWGAKTLAFIDDPSAAAGTLARVATALWVQCRYAGLFLWPVELSSDYSFDAIPVVASATDPRLWLGLLWAATLAFGLVAGWRRSRPVATAVATWVLFFLPASNLLFASGTIMAERLAYLPSLGGCLFVGHAAAWLAARGPRAARAVVIAATIVLIALGARTVARNPVWKDNLTLAVHDATHMPRSAKLQAGAGIALQASGRQAEAEAAYRRALAIYPDYAQIHANLGQLLASRGATQEAIEHFARALELAPHRADVRKALTRLLDQAGRR